MADQDFPREKRNATSWGAWTVAKSSCALVDQARNRRTVEDPIAHALGRLNAGIVARAESLCALGQSAESVEAQLLSETRATLAVLGALDAGTDIIAAELASQRPHLN